jgi:lysophospholipase L1-like esterase
VKWSTGCRSALEELVRWAHEQPTDERGLPVARLSEHFTPPWTGKFAPDRFHPSTTGYRDWARALLTAIT